jgi:hypothetical protein
MLCRERDLQRKRPKNRKIGETKNAEINNIVYMELYSGPKIVNDKDLKTKYLRSKNREFIVLHYCLSFAVSREALFLYPLNGLIQLFGITVLLFIFLFFDTQGNLESKLSNVAYLNSCCIWHGSPLNCLYKRFNRGEDIDWIELNQVRILWCAVTNMVRFHVP